MKVSVCMITYNHEDFISQALDSVLMQDVGFEYEIVLGEDCSTDNTGHIVRDYARRFRDRVQLLPAEKNLGMMLNFIRTLRACRGQYIALCEGDDYWTSRRKLQTQVDFLDSHADFAICSHNVEVAHEAGALSHEWLGPTHKEVLTLEDLLRDGSGGATCSLVFRRTALRSLPDWFQTIAGGDWALQVLCASHGKLRYFRDVMGVYRRHSRGALYAQTVAAKAEGEEAIALASKNSLGICDTLDTHFSYRYHELVQKQKAYWYWIGAMEYAQHGKTGPARTCMSRALPHVLPLPRWLTFAALLRGLWVVFVLPCSFVRFLRAMRSRVKARP